MSLVAPLLLVLVFMAMVMAGGWWWQKRTDNGGWIDVFWTYGTGLSGAAVALWTGAGSLRAWLVAIVVGIWALRLGTFIALRVARGGAEDTRYAALKAEWGAAYNGRIFGFMQIQGPITVLLCLAIALAASRTGPLGLTDVLGALVLVIAIGGESVADQQMAAFRADKANKGKVCTNGLWGWSRHPNYFFEFVTWLAYPVIAFAPSGHALWPLALLAPLTMYLVLRFGTGVPPLEKAMLASRGEAFRRYQARVSPFFPLPPRSQPSRS
jgi:steroid 5-alpha reductase family enzyme